MGHYLQLFSTRTRGSRRRDVQLVNDTLKVDDCEETGGDSSTRNEGQGDDAQQGGGVGDGRRGQIAG